MDSSASPRLEKEYLKQFVQPVWQYSPVVWATLRKHRRCRTIGKIWHVTHFRHAPMPASVEVPARLNVLLTVAQLQHQVPNSTTNFYLNSTILKLEVKDHLRCLSKLWFQVTRSCITTLLAPMTVMFLATAVRKWCHVAWSIPTTDSRTLRPRKLVLRVTVTVSGINFTHFFVVTLSKKLDRFIIFLYSQAITSITSLCTSKQWP